MRHREPFTDNLIAHHINHHSAIVATIAPAIHHIGAAHCGDLTRLAVAHAKTIQVTAILCGKFGNKRRLPIWLEIVLQAGLGQARIGVRWQG